MIARRIAASAFRDTLLDHPRDLLAGGTRGSDNGFAYGSGPCFGEWDGS